MSYPERRKGRLTGKWIAEPTLNGVRLGRKSFDTKVDADRWEDFMKATGNPPPSNVPVLDKGVSFGEVAKEFITSKSWERDVAGLARVNVVVDMIGRDTPIKLVATSTLDKLVKDLKRRSGVNGKDKLTPGTINRYLSAASGVLHYGRVREYSDRQVVVPWQPDEAKRIIWLTEAQEAALMKALEDQGQHTIAVIARALVETGMRWSELYNLEPEQIEPDTGWVRLWKTKTNSPRSVPITPSTAVALRRLVEAGIVPEYYTMRNILKRAVKSAGLNPTFSVHGFRHTTATRLIQAGVNLRIVQQYMGHRRIETTLRYAHVVDENLQDALKKLSPRAGETSNIVLFPREKAEQLEATAGIEPACTDLQSDL